MLARLDQLVTNIRSSVYDALIVSMTTGWYREVLLECPVGTAMLDVGIGTASSLIANRDIVLSKKMTVVGVDCDAHYVLNAQKSIRASNLQDVVQCETCGIHDYNQDYSTEFDVVYFSGSFMIISHPVEALRHCVKMLRCVSPVPNACNIFFTQTLERRSFIGEYITPWVKYFLKAVTTIDFGEVTYEDEFRKVLESAEVDIVEMRPLKKGWLRTQMMVMAHPRSSGGE